MKKFIMSFVACLVACCTFLLSSFEVNAANTVYLPYDKPSTSPFSGYLTVYTSNGAVGTYLWTIFPESKEVNNDGVTEWEVDSSIMDLKIDFTNDKITFEPYLGVDIIGTCAIYSITGSSGLVRTLYSNDAFTETTSYTFSFSNDLIYAVPYGNVGDIEKVGSHTLPDVEIVYNEDSVAVKTLQEIFTIISQDSELLEQYLPLISSMRFYTENNNVVLRQLKDILDLIKTDIETYYSLMNTQLQDINDLLWQMNEYLQNEPSADDRDKIEDFDTNSSSQSTELDNLNQQTQVQKPNIDDMSNKVDANLNMDIDANYGLLLSAFTSNNRILSMLLIVASVSLVSYVFFGKR